MSLYENNKEEAFPASQMPSFPPVATIPAEIRQFLENIIKETGLAPDDEVYEEMMKELFVHLDQFLTSRIVEALSDEDFETFIEMTDQGKPMAEMQNFIHQHIANAADVITNAFIAFRNHYLGIVGDEELSEDEADVELSLQEEIVAFLKTHTPNIRKAFREAYQQSLMM